MSSPMKFEKAEKTAPERPPAAETFRAETKTRGGRTRQVVILGLLAVLVIAGAIFGGRTVSFYRHHETTDDAQIDGHINPILPRVSGYVSEVRVNENQPVHAGDVLVQIDTRDLQSKVDQ